MADVRPVVERALGDTRRAVGFELLELDDSVPPRIRFVGPLGRERRIKLDLTDDELVVDTKLTPLLRRWPDVAGDLSLRAYTETEITGEKLRCVMQRLQCRDVLDLDALFEQLHVDADEATLRFRAKAEHRGIEPDGFAERYRERLADYERRWQTELSEQLGHVPHFDAVERRVARHLRSARLL